MKRIFLSLIITLSFVNIQASNILVSEENEAPWAYTISSPNGGRLVITEEYGTIVSQNYVKTKLYTLEKETDGIRFTVLETNKPQTANGYCYFVLGEFTIFDANGNIVEYTATSNADYNEYHGPDGDGIPALNDGVLNNFFHSDYSSSTAPDAHHYIELTFDEPVNAFSIEWYGRPNNSNYEFSPTISGITPKGYEFTADMVIIDDDDDDDDDDIIEDNEDEEDDTVYYNTVDVFTEPCLFVSLSNGGIDAYSLKTLAKEQYKDNDTLYIPLTSGNTIKYHVSEYTGISNKVPEFPYFTSYKFNNKYNANLNTDVVADCKNETIEVTLNAIGKSLTASFQLSEERAVAYIGNKLQTSKETRNRFENDVKYTVTYPGYNIIQNVKVKDGSYKDIKIPFGRVYTIATQWLTDNGEVPRIDIDMIHSEWDITKETYLDAKFTISGFGVYDNFEDSVQIKGRGNSTWGYPKKPYRLKFASKVKPFGLTKGKSWVLLANYQYGALMANAIAMKVGQLANVPYTNHIIPVELYINGEYKGNYMFTEHIGMSNNSVDIDEDLGYMLELDDYFDEDFKFRSSRYYLPVNVKDPDLYDYSEEERNEKFNIIKEDFKNFENALFNNEEIGKYLDLDAAARFLLVNELILNMELCHPKSTFLWKGDMYSSESKITFGPLWDFDWAFGYEKTRSYFDIDYKSEMLSIAHATYGKNFFHELMKNKEFKKHYYKVWKEFIKKGYIEEVKEYISDYYTFVESSFMNNANMWAGDGYDYGTKIETMQNWMQNRHDYIAANLKKYDITDLIHTIVGDIDCNDLLTIHDIALLADYLIDKTDENFNTGKADIDNNGNVDNSDLKMTVNLVANSDPVPPMYYYNTPVSQTSIIAMNGTSVSEDIINIPVYLQNNKEGIKAIQADITVPSDIWIDNISTKNKANGDTVVYVQITSELYRVVAYNKNGTPFACDTPVFDIKLSNSGYTSEAGVAQIKDILVVDSANIEKRINDAQFDITNKEEYSIIYIVDGEIYKVVTLEKGKNITLIEEPTKAGYTFSGWSDAPANMPANDIVIEGTFTHAVLHGDANMDGVVSISDIVTVINYILEKPVNTFNFTAADVTGNENISIGDVVGIVNIILNSVVEKTSDYIAKRSAIVQSDNHLSMSDVSGEAGIVSMPVTLSNSVAYTAFQMDVELPEGATITSASLSKRATISHSITWHSIYNNKVRLIAYSPTNAAFIGNDGELVTLNIEAADGTNGIVTVDNVLMATTEGIENAISGCGAAIEINGTTAIGSNSADATIKINGNCITLVNANDCNVTIYSTEGVLVEKIDNYSGEEIMLDNGIYIIRIENKTVKIKI